MGSEKLSNLLQLIDIQADWIGLREVKESTTYRCIRDGNPQANTKDSTRGILVEVLSEGQFGYYGTNKINQQWKTKTNAYIRSGIFFQQREGTLVWP